MFLHGSRKIKIIFDYAQYERVRFVINLVMIVLFSLKGGTFGLYIRQGYVYITYNLGTGDVIGRSNIIIKTGYWYTVSATFNARFAYLIVRDETGLIKLTLYSKFFS